MVKFTPEQLQRLAKFEQHFSTAVYSGYIRGAGEIDKRTLVEVMEEATGLRYGDILLETCGTCIMNFVREVGTLYFESIAAQKADEAAKRGAQARETPQTVNDTKKPQTAPKRAKKAKK